MEKQPPGISYEKYRTKNMTPGLSFDHKMDWYFKAS